MVVVATVTALFALAGCGGGSGSDISSAPTSAPKPISSTSSTILPRRPGGAADAETKALAVAGVLDPVDFGSAWTIYSKNTGAVPERAAQTGCGITASSPFRDLPLGAIQAGPTMKFGSELHYVGSSAFAFPTASDAEREIRDVASKAWATCKRGELQKFQDDHITSDTRFTVALDTRSTPGIGTRGFESYARFEIRDSEGDIVGYTEYSYYRVGRVVIRVQADTGAIKDQTAFQKNNDAYTALTAAYARVAKLQTPTSGTTTTAGG
jgi:hypothetical protein